MNNNTKFTFNKKGLALSLACVGLLATAGNAEIKPDNAVSKVNDSTTNYNVTVSKLTSNLTITGEGNTLGFTSGGAMTISGGVTFGGTGSLEKLDLFNASGSGMLILKNDLDINVNAGTINLGKENKFTDGATALGNSGAFTISGGALNFGNKTFDKVSFNNLKFSGGGSIVNTGHIKEMVIEQYGIVNMPSNKDTGEMKFQNTGTIDILTNKTNMFGKGFEYKKGEKASGAITLEMGNIGTYNQQASLGYLTINGGTFGVFNNSVEDSKGFINQSTIKNITVGTFNNDGAIKNSTITNASITTFNNTGYDGKHFTTIDQNLGGLKGVTLKNSTIGTLYNTGHITDVTFSGGVIGTLINSGSGVIKGLNTKGDAYIKNVFNNTGNITNSTIKVGKDATNLATKFTNSGVISGGTSVADTLTVFTKDFTNTGKINFASGNSTTGTIHITADNFTNAKDAQITINSKAQDVFKITAENAFNNAGTIKGISGAATGPNAGLITLEGEGSERNAAFAGINSGLIQVDTIKFNGYHKSFENSGTISGGNITGSGEILTFTNTGDIKDSNVYVMPYYRSTSVDLAEGSLDADTYGIVLGGNKNLGNAGVIGLFLGYENADGSANNLDTEDDTFFGGINYYKTLGGTSTYDYFVKGMLRLANTSSDLTRTSPKYETSSADTFSYGIEANVGMNFYNGIHTITPEVGLSYDRVEVDGFKLNGVDYSDNNINLVVGKIGLNWLAQFTESVSTNVGFGIRYNFNDDFDTSLRIANGEVYSTKTDLGDFYYYLNLGVNYAITSNWELGVMYNCDFSSDASSHSGFVKLGYWW